MKIGVVGGTGYTGVVMSCLAESGFSVTLLGRNKDKIKAINSGRSPIYEPSMDEMLENWTSQGKVRATDSYDELRDADVIFITVGTPPTEDGSIDLSQVKEASAKIGKLLRESEGYKLVVVKSTVPPGTTRTIVIPMLEEYSGKKAGIGFGVCMNPEFLREGHAVSDFLNPDKILIGSDDGRSCSVMEMVYSKFDSNIPRIRTDILTAEMIKYVQNAALSSRISFMNEVANICEAYGVDVKEVEKAIGTDGRIGNRFLRAGLGFGGSCLPKDLDSLIKIAEASGISPFLLKGVKEVNDRQPLRAVELARDALGDLKGRRVSILGVAFKPGTDDMRSAPSIRIINELISAGAAVKIYDPKAMDNARTMFGDRIDYAESLEECVGSADLCILVTEWDEFRKLEQMDIKCPLVDGRRILSPDAMKSRNIHYLGIGWKNKN